MTTNFDRLELETPQDRRVPEVNPSMALQFWAQAITGRRTPINGSILIVGPGGSRSNTGSSANNALDSYGTALRRLAAKNAAASSGIIKDNLILGLPGHAETAAVAASSTAGMLFSVAGTTVWQLGEGAGAATITINGVVGANIHFNATDCYIVGGKIVAGLDNLTAPIDIDEDRCGLKDVEFEIGGSVTDTPTNWIVVAAKDRIAIERCRLEEAETGSTSFLSIPAAATNLSFQGNYIHGDFSTALVNNTSAAYVDLVNIGNDLQNTNSSVATTFARLTGATEVVEHEGERWNMLVTAVDLATGSNGTQGAKSLLAVTGEIEVMCEALCTEDLAGASATIEAGVSGATAALIAQTTATDIDAGEQWKDASPAVIEAVTAKPRVRITNGADVIVTIATADITDGNLLFHTYWRSVGRGGRGAAVAWV